MRPKPAVHIDDIVWSRELLDCLKTVGARAYRGWGNFKASKLNSHLSKDKLRGVQGDANATTGVKPLSCLKEHLLDGVRPHQGVIHAFGLPWDVRHDLVEVAAVAITRDNVPLWGDTVVIAAPRCDECGKMAVVLM